MATAADTTRTTIRRATTSDAALFTALAESTFVHTFGADNRPEDMTLYLGEAFGEDIQRRELGDPRNTVLLAEQGGSPVGYAMLREDNAPDCVADRSAIEIARLYAVSHAIGKGIGAALMQRCFDVAVERGRRTVWLGVWEHNPRAIAFYQKWGFVDAGAKAFVLGRDQQTDRVMTRAVERAEHQGVACAIR
ncbi:MAG: GNAT family N-acetyltransferase [Gemmatimonadota bacterium]|nr:GNAT family N-acetyltransferase [Gemmatimonadota bacterium]